MKRLEKILPALCCLLAGVILGFLIAPVKRGITCVNYEGGALPPDGCACDDEDSLER